MKDHKQIGREIDAYELAGPFDEALRLFQSLATDLIDPHVETSWDGTRIIVSGWRPMTERELERARRKSERAREAAAVRKAKALEAERKEYERLKAKFND